MYYFFNLVVIIGLDYVEKCKQNFYSRFLYFVFPNKIIHLKNKREELSKKIKHFVKKYIGEVEDKIKNNEKSDNLTALDDHKVSKNLKKKISEELDRFYVNFNIISDNGI